METQLFSSRSLEQERQMNLTKQTFEQGLMSNLYLTKVRAPLFVSKDSGLNDNLNGTEQPVTFKLQQQSYEVVHSLAKWKRWYLGQVQASRGEGIVTDMNAIRTGETLSAIHSNLVDQWDWEKVISKPERTIDTLIQHGQLIYNALRDTHQMIHNQESDLPQNITVVYTEDLLQEYPTLSAKEREHTVAKTYGAVLLIGIGGALSTGEPHDLRAPDYDDWTTEHAKGRYGLNADILVWDTTRNKSLELSSMGIRVDEVALEKQLKLKGLSEADLKPYHKAILDQSLPYTIGGGIGQSRVLMFLNRLAHIKMVQPIY